MPELDVDVRLNYTTSNREPCHYAELRVTDKASGKLVIDIPLLPEQVYAILSGQGTYTLDVKANVPTPDQFAHLGKECHTFTRLFQVDYNTKGDMPISRAREVREWLDWGEEVRTRLGFHSSSWTDQNNGKRVTFHYYANELDPMVLGVLQADVDRTPAPKGLK